MRPEITADSVVVVPVDPSKFDPAKDKRDPLLKQVADIAVKYMEMTVASNDDKGGTGGGGGGIALLPHHTQMITLLMLAIQACQGTGMLLLPRTYI